MSRYLPRPTPMSMAILAFVIGAAVSTMPGAGHLGVVFALIGVGALVGEMADTLSDIRRDAREHHEQMYRRLMEMYANVEDVDRIIRKVERESES